MSNEVSGSTQLTPEQEVEVQQEEPESSDQQSAAEADGEQATDDVEDGTKNADSATVVSDQPAADENGWTQQNPQEGEATSGDNVQDSRESSVSNCNSGTESYRIIHFISDNIKTPGSDRGRESKQGSESREVEDVSSECTVIMDLTGQFLPGSRTANSSSAENSYETALVDDKGSELIQVVEARIPNAFVVQEQVCMDPNGPDSHESGTTGSSSTGNSYETAVVGDSSSGGVAGDISGSTPDPAGTFFTDSMALGASASHYESVPDQRESRRCYQNVFDVCGFVCYIMKPCSRVIRRSNTCTLLKMVLMIVPLSAMAMGMAFSTSCPVKIELPVLTMVLGILGFLYLSLGLGLDYRLCGSTNGVFIPSIIKVLSFFILGIFAAAIVSTYSMSPSFDPVDHENYCHMTFYYYAYYMNFIGIAIAILSLCVYIPTWNEDFDEYEEIY